MLFLRNTYFFFPLCLVLLYVAALVAPRAPGEKPAADKKSSAPKKEN